MFEFQLLFFFFNENFMFILNYAAFVVKHSLGTDEFSSALKHGLFLLLLLL
jgi:hypothetical protein